MVCIFKSQPIGFILIGLLTVFVNLTVFSFLDTFGLELFISVGLGNLASVTVNYIGLSILFSSKKNINNLTRYALSFAAYYILSLMIMFSLTNFYQNNILNRVLALIILTPINYFAQKFFVFNKINLKLKNF